MWMQHFFPTLGPPSHGDDPYAERNEAAASQGLQWCFSGLCLEISIQVLPYAGGYKKKNLQVTCGAPRLQALHLFGHNQET